MEGIRIRPTAIFKSLSIEKRQLELCCSRGPPPCNPVLPATLCAAGNPLDGGELLRAGHVGGGGHSRPRLHGDGVHVCAGDGGRRGGPALLWRARQLRSLPRGGTLPGTPPNVPYMPVQQGPNLAGSLTCPCCPAV